MRLGYTHIAFVVAVAATASPGSARAQNQAQDQDLAEVVSYLTAPSEAPNAGLFIHGNLAFVGGHSTGYYTNDNVGVRIVDLADPENPQLRSRIPLRTFHWYGSYSYGGAVAVDLDSEYFKGTIAVVMNGVPDTYRLRSWVEPYGVWDVTDPANPEFLSIFGPGKHPSASVGDLGDYPQLSTAIAGNLFFFVYDAASRPRQDRSKMDRYLGIVDLSDPFNPTVVGSWQEDSDASLQGVFVNEAGTRAYVTAVWPKPFGNRATHTFVYTIDVSDPTQPKTLGKFVLPLRNLGDITSAFIAVATADDAITVYADGAWGGEAEDARGILHILDTSDPSDIKKITEFDAAKASPLDRWYMAHNLSVRGSTVYSAWLDGGVVSIDISDPANPEMIGQWLSKWIVDAVPLGNDYVVASPVWKGGLYVLRDNSVGSRATAAETDGTVPTATVLHQNYPNPFSAFGGGTQISFELPATTSARLSVFDVTGREVAVLVNETLGAGRHVVRFEPDGLPGGVYLYRLRTASFEVTRRAVVATRSSG